MPYQKIQPCKLLAPFIESIWLQENDVNAAVEKFPPTKVVPANAIEIAFYFRDAFIELKNSYQYQLPKTAVTGQKTQFKEYLASGKTGIVIVRFKPWGARPFLHLPLDELLNRNVDLNCILPQKFVRVIEEKLPALKTAEARVKSVQNFLINRFDRNFFDERMAEAVLTIDQHHGRLPIGEIADKLSISKRQFERRFKTAIGISPKKYSMITRFQRALFYHKNGKYWPEIVFNCQYYDQAHFIKEMKNFSGLSPEAIFKKGFQTKLASFFNQTQGLSQFYNIIYL